jgi:hypothetical protein
MKQKLLEWWQNRQLNKMSRALKRLGFREIVMWVDANGDVRVLHYATDQRSLNISMRSHVEELDKDWKEIDRDEGY